MEELELVGLHEDGEHLVLLRADGGHFRVRIDEPLRAAARRDRPQMEQLRAEGAGTLSPREIQTRIRAGATAQEVADSSGLTVDHVRRFEGPVLAEREYVAEQARGTRIGRDSGAPSLGDLVTDRLAARGVDAGSLAWDAARHTAGPWTVLARFSVDGTAHEARWIFDASARSVTADEDEARWLSETEIADEPVARRHLAAVRDVVFDFDSTVAATGAIAVVETTSAEAAAEAEKREETHDLLDDLRTRRGVRQAIEVDDDADEFEGFGPQHAFDFAHLEASVPGAHPVDADDEVEAVVLQPPDKADPAPAAGGARRQPVAIRPTHISALPAPEPGTMLAGEPVKGPDKVSAGDSDRPRSRRTRAKVPSWDEIVFGARPE